MTELETNLRSILTEKETKLLPEVIKKGTTILGVRGDLDTSDITVADDYQKCLGLADAILSDSGLTPYYELEYLETSGTQYVDTGIVPTNHKLEIKFQYKDATNNASLFGTTSATYHMTWFNSKWYYACNSTDTEYNFSTIPCTDLQTVIFNNDNNKISFNGVEYGSTEGTSNAKLSLTLFTRADGSAGNARTKFYYTKMYDKSTGELVRDFIPVMDLYGIVCLYDKVSENFFYNAGTGVFTAGPRT